MATERESNLRRTCGLWKTKRASRTCLSAKIKETITINAGETIYIFAARERKNANSPSHELLAAHARAQQQRDDEDLSL